MQALDGAPADLPGRSDDAMRMMLSALQAVAQGDFGMELRGHWEGLEGHLADAFNTVVRSNRELARELARHEVAQVYDPEQVEAEVERFAPHLVFLDIGMPGRSGYEIARSLRQRHAASALGIVAVTGWGHAEDRSRSRSRSREAGFDEHLVKPPQLDAIRRLCAAGGRDTQP
ncbi:MULTISPECIES: response regulator [unclassified Luteimonas]